MAWGQQNAPAPPKPVDSGPTLAATMQFIQEKLSEQGQVSWAESSSNIPDVVTRNFFSIMDVMADPAACTLYMSATFDQSTDIPKGKVLTIGGKKLTAEDLKKHNIDTETLSFKQVEKIVYFIMQDYRNATFKQAAHPEITATVKPPVYCLSLSSSNAVVVTSHSSTTVGNQAPVVNDGSGKSVLITIRDEETTKKLVKAMTHAVELCGGGITKKDLF